MMAQHIITHPYLRDRDSSPVRITNYFNGIWHNAHQPLQVFLSVNTLSSIIIVWVWKIKMCVSTGISWVVCKLCCRSENIL